MLQHTLPSQFPSSEVPTSTPLHRKKRPLERQAPHNGLVLRRGAVLRRSSCKDATRYGQETQGGVQREPRLEKETALRPWMCCAISYSKT